MKSTKERLAELASLVALACVVIVTGIVVRREFFTPDPQSQDAAPVRMNAADWERQLASGHRIGPASTPITLVVFGDFQCPACRRFATRTWPAIRTQYGDSVALVYRHFALDYHKWAKPAAVAAECAGKQGRFEALHDLLYAQQDSLGDKPFESFAAQAGVRDSSAYASCTADSSLVRRIDADAEAALLLGATGTPTVAVNGYRFTVSPDSLRLVQFIEAQLKSRR